MTEGIGKSFPPTGSVETPPVLRALVAAHRSLAELKGMARTIPNEGLLLSTLSLQEAQSSSEIENVITTQDALYRHHVQPPAVDPATKDVARYADGLHKGLRTVRKAGLLTLNTILEIQAVLAGNNAGLRKTPGTVMSGSTIIQGSAMPASGPASALAAPVRPCLRPSGITPDTASSSGAC